MKRILILDTETSGIDATRDHVVEVGAILYDLEHAAAISSWSALVRSSSNAAESVNRIPSALLASLDEIHTLEALLRIVRSMADHATAVVAYSAEFDRAFVEIANGGPIEIDGPPDEFGGTKLVPIPWVCAMNDLEWPRTAGGSRSLVALALAHDLGVAHAHRALADCELLARLFTRARELGADLSAMMERGLRPKARVVARVSYDDREKAKAAGFHWDGKVWARVMALEDVAALPFPTSVAPGSPGDRLRATLPVQP